LRLLDGAFLNLLNDDLDHFDVADTICLTRMTLFEKFPYRVRERSIGSPGLLFQ
jgi:hypothetical protein